MIDSNNLDVIRKNIKELAAVSDPDVINNLITNVDANTDAIGDLNSLVGATPLPEGETITLAISELIRISPFSNSVLGATFARSGQTLTLRFYTTPGLEDDDTIIIQFRGGNNDIRFVIKESGVTTYDKKVTLS